MAAGPRSPLRRGGARHGRGAAARAGAVRPRVARLVREWTTRPEFLSPLVDHLPVSKSSPEPKDVLGYHIGAPKKLTSVGDQQRYFQALEKSTPRVRTMVVGKTEEGRDILIAFVSSEANIRQLEANRQNLKKLADP